MEPFGWTPYLDSCLRILNEENETELDDLLIIQVKCHLIMNQATHSSSEWSGDGDVKAPPQYFIKAMLSQIHDIQKGLSLSMQTNSWSNQMHNMH